MAVYKWTPKLRLMPNSYLEPPYKAAIIIAQKRFFGFESYNLENYARVEPLLKVGLEVFPRYSPFNPGLSLPLDMFLVLL